VTFYQKLLLGFNQASAMGARKMKSP